MGKDGVGMPAALMLEEFGDMVSHAFDGEVPYQVGSSLETTQWRDVDVRLMLSDEAYAAQGYGNPRYPEFNAKWCAMCRAFSALGRQMTGLPIDFQIQQTSRANETFTGPRNALGVHATFRRQILCGISGDDGSRLIPNAEQTDG